MDKATEQQVWQRVYAQNPLPPRLTSHQKQNLRRCMERANANLRYYESQSRDPVYREAFGHMAQQTAEHIKMMRQMLRD